MRNSSRGPCGACRTRLPARSRSWSAEMRKLLNRKIMEQDGKCAICHAAFTDYNEIVPDHIEPKGMGGAWRDDHPENIQAVCTRCYSAYSGPANSDPNPKQQVRRLLAADQFHSSPIGFHHPGRLPSSRCIRSAPEVHLGAKDCETGAPDTALRLAGSNPAHAGLRPTFGRPRKPILVG